MKFGTVLSMAPKWGGIEEVPRYAKLIEQLGYDHIWFTDERFQRNVYVNMALAALNTRTVTLGTCVTNPYFRHPLTTAAAVGTINELSGGRTILGIGAGASTIFERHNIERPHSPLRAIKETIEVLRPVMKGNVVSYTGRTMSFSGVNLDFESKPVPIYIACRGPKLFQLAGELADGVIIGSLASKEGLRFALENLKKGAERVGRDLDDIDVVFWSYFSMLNDDKKAKNLVKRIVVSSMWSSKSILKYIGVNKIKWAPIEKTLRKGFEEGLPPDDVYRQAYNLISDDVLDVWSVTGNPDTVARKVKEIIDAGIDHFACLPFGESRKEIKEMQKQFAEIIIPQFR